VLDTSQAGSEAADQALAAARAVIRHIDLATTDLAAGVSTAQDGVATLGNAYREASLALGRLGPRGGVLSLPDLSAFEYLLLRGDQVARRLIAPQIERFVVEDREHGGQLTRTLLAYAEADPNAKAAAEALLIHVNTAHYRLARIAEKTG
jgi:DNA-binding PucR family transcriptional regulator